MLLVLYLAIVTMKIINMLLFLNQYNIIISLILGAVAFALEKQLNNINKFDLKFFYY